MQTGVSYDCVGDHSFELENDIKTFIAKDYLGKKGIITTRIKTIPKGKSQPRKLCKANTDCSDADHKQNQRVEFLVYKN